MKLRPVNKLDKTNKKTSKKLTMTSFQKIVTSLSLFGFLAYLEQSGDRISATESEKQMFLVILAFCLTKTENRTRKPPTQLSHYCFE